MAANHQSQFNSIPARERLPLAYRYPKSVAVVLLSVLLLTVGAAFLNRIGWACVGIGIEFIAAAAAFNSPLAWLCCGPAVGALVSISPLPESISPEGQAVAATAFLMAIWWMSEVIPLGATALLPIVLFPLLGVRSTDSVMPSYAHWIVYLVMGGFMIAAGMQKWGLHKRLALWTIDRIGVTPSRMVLGFTIATACISMWVTNTATALMMLPVAAAVIEYIRKNSGEEAVRGLAPALMLSIAYASSIGGVGTIIGTGPNGVFAAQAFELFGRRIGFVTWLGIGLPCVVILIPLAWIYLTRFAFHMPPATTDAKAAIDCERRALGPMSRGEKSVAWIFGLTALLWIARRSVHFGDVTLPGFDALLPHDAKGSSLVNDATIGIFGALLMFIIPVNLKKKEFVLDVKTAIAVPWDVLLILGGGIALANGFADSGLSKWVANQAIVLKDVHPAILVLLVTIVLTFLTELTSNTATSTIFIPILASAAIGLGQHPYLFMIPCTIAVSMAFMLPVATPPNAIAFSSGYVRAQDMARAGFWLNWIAIAVITLLMLYVIAPFMDIQPDTVPEWALK